MTESLVRAAEGMTVNEAIYAPVGMLAALAVIIGVVWRFLVEELGDESSGADYHRNGGDGELVGNVVAEGAGALQEVLVHANDKEIDEEIYNRQDDDVLLGRCSLGGAGKPDA